MRKFTDILTLDRIKDIESVTKDEILAELSTLLAGAPEVTAPKTLLTAIRAREAIMSTGIGMGIAIPHAKISSVTDIIMAVGRSIDGIDFQSLDNRPVHLIIMIVASDTQGEEFLKILGKIGTFFTREGITNRFLEAGDPVEILRLFAEIDAESLVQS